MALHPSRVDASSFWRRVRYLPLLLVPGMMANALALTAPGAVPALLGSTAAFALALRLPLVWSLLAALPLGAVTGELRWTAYTLLATAWLWLLRQTGRGWLVVTPCWALPLCALGWWWLPPELRTPLDQALGVSVLLLGGLAALALASMVDRLAVNHRAGSLAPLADLLSARVGLVVLGPIVVLLLAGLQALWQSRATEAVARLQANARDFATEAMLYIESQRNIIRFAAADTRLPAKFANLAGLHQAFPGFLTLLISDAEGDIVFYHAPEHRGFGGNVADRSYFLEPQRDGGSYISGVFRGRGFGNDLLVAISAPHRNERGDFAGVVQGRCHSAISATACRQRRPLATSSSD